MGLGISNNSIYSNLNESSFVPFQAATSTGGGLKCYSCQPTNSLICFASGLWLLFDYLTKRVCVLWDSTKHFHFVPEFQHYLATSVCLSDLENFRTYMCLLL